MIRQLVLPKVVLRATSLLAGLAASLGCASDNPDAVKGGVSGASGSGQGGAASASAGAGANVHGDIVVTLAAPAGDLEGYTALIGRFFDGPSPVAFALELDTEIGDCQLLVPARPFCSTPCGPDVCTADNVCTSYPAPLSVGTLSIGGLGSALTLAPATKMSVYQSPSLPFPPCEEGATVTAAAAGFELASECIAPLELTGPDPVPVGAAAAVRLTWTAPTSSTNSRVRIGLDISHHGGTKGEINCEVSDTGSFDIPEPLVTRLVEFGLAGYPTISVNRVAIGTDPNHPNVALVLTSGVTRAVDTGVASCQEDVECPGQVCLPERVCG